VTRGAPIRVWVTRTFSGRAIVGGLLLKVVAFVLTLAGGRTTAAGAIDTFGDIAVVAGALAVGFRLFVDLKQRLLWRVRRKLSVSYIFIGFVPALLIITFFLLCGLLLINNLSAHLIASRLGELEREALLLARQAVVDLERAPTEDQIRVVLENHQQSAGDRYPGASFLVLPSTNRCAAASRRELAGPIAVGPWKHEEAPQSIPEWIKCGGYAGVRFYVDESRREGERVPSRPMARALAWPSSAARQYAVVVDLPVTTEVAYRFRDETGVELMEVTGAERPGGVLIESVPDLGNRRVEDATGALATADDSGGLFRRRFVWFAYIPVTEWDTGMKEFPTVAISVSAADVYDRIAPAEQVGSLTFNRMLLVIVAIVGGLFLIIQLAAFGMGLALARSITGSVHELFAGTERVRRGDFRGRVAVQSRDQLGELAESFNSMTASIEDLLQQKAEKERLEQELRIARSIQMSLLPQGPMTLPGVSLTAHCEPAREVGGDYYDFLPIDDHTIGILVADVSGKGTSAALYMAELKGIMLSLCERYTSPRALLIEVDRIISRHLDSRSFITVSYLVMDVRAGTLRYARAGHCPLIYVPGPSAASRAPRLLTPDGLVLGLQLDEGRTFSRLLEEATLSLTPGDVFLLYTDGISEAMNVDGECFGDTRLAELVGQHADLPADELRERILRDISAFAGPASQHDDMTMVLLRVEQMAAVENALTA
jgi:sigma-B regulation protein RsbU (phosphoserine phosphatase)